MNARAPGHYPGALGTRGSLQGDLQPQILTRFPPLTMRYRARGQARFLRCMPGTERVNARETRNMKTISTDRKTIFGRGLMKA